MRGEAPPDGSDIRFARAIANLVVASLVVVSALATSAAAAAPLEGEADYGAASGFAFLKPKPIEAAEAMDQPEPVSPVGFTVSGGTTEQRQLALWAVKRFEDAGLAVSSVDIHLHQDLAQCNGNRGIYSGGSQRIDICVNERTVVLHEIAHAWNHQNLSDSQRSDYVSAGGFGSWGDPGTPWFDRGSEDAADTIAWALLDEQITLVSPDGPIARRDAAYLLLTGRHAPRVNT